MKLLSILAACIVPLTAFSAEPKVTFEVASIKPAAPAAIGDFHAPRKASGPRYGPGTADPTRWACDGCPLRLLLTDAYNLKRFQIAGPAWLDTERFDITARVAEGATKDDLRLMQQNLLAERFGLKAHLDKKEMQVYDLLVGKNGSKLKKAGPAKPAADGPATHSAGGHDGSGGWGRQFASNRTITMTMHGSTRHQAVGENMQEFADVLALQLDRPVTDSTGLTGKFDFVLTFSGGNAADGGGAMAAMFHGGGQGGGASHDGLDSDAAQPPLQKAVQDQLGLRLEAKKGVAARLTIDHLDKVPSEN